MLAVGPWFAAAEQMLRVLVQAQPAVLQQLMRQPGVGQEVDPTPGSSSVDAAAVAAEADDGSMACHPPPLLCI